MRNCPAQYRDWAVEMRFQPCPTNSSLWLWVPGVASGHRALGIEALTWHMWALHCPASGLSPPFQLPLLSLPSPLLSQQGLWLQTTEIPVALLSRVGRVKGC